MIPNIADVFSEVISAIFSKGKLNMIANFSATNLTLAGSFGFPLYGSGLKNGESVSIKIRSNGNCLATSGK